jgi:hypothetical protein
MSFFRSSLLAAAVLLAGCAGGPQVRTDQAPAADLRAYQTFAFFEQPATERGGYQSIVTQRATLATRQQLEALGYRYQPSNPDLGVNFHVNVAEKVDLRSMPGSMHTGRYRSWNNSVETDRYREGTLRIDLVDMHKKVLVWQGVAEGRLEPRASSQASAAVDAAVAEIFAGLRQKQAAR